MKIPIWLPLILLSGCYTYRPPTTAVELADVAPEHATRVGGPLPFWTEAGECHSPPTDVVRMAERWGADVVVPHVVGAKRSPFFCGADAYAVAGSER